MQRVNRFQNTTESMSLPEAGTARRGGSPGADAAPLSAPQRQTNRSAGGGRPHRRVFA